MECTVGFVAIGRNEGEHLERCLRSIVRPGHLVVYVDSGSTDNSVAMARGMGVEVVDLDMSTPFTAARARNAGYARLMALQPDLAFVHFIDGDCHLADGWLVRALASLRADAGLGAVFGQRRELHPEHSVFNASCNLEWNTPLGGETPFGGEVLMRTAAFEAAGRYDPSVVASEDFECWLRLRAAGWRTERVDAVMSWHDARILGWHQWWKRSERTGHAFGQVASMHGDEGGRNGHRHDVKRSLRWGLVMPALLLALAWPTRGLSLLGFALYAVPAWRGYRYGIGRGWDPAATRGWAMLNAIVKFPEALGVLRWQWRRLTGGPLTIIEYKGPAAAAQPAATGPRRLKTS